MNILENSNLSNGSTHSLPQTVRKMRWEVENSFPWCLASSFTHTKTVSSLLPPQGRANPAREIRTGESKKKENLQPMRRVIREWRKRKMRGCCCWVSLGRRGRTWGRERKQMGGNESLAFLLFFWENYLCGSHWRLLEEAKTYGPYSLASWGSHE